MPVCSYYCAACGVKLAPEDVRQRERPALRDLTCYCPSCALELGTGTTDVRAPEMGLARPTGRAPDLPPEGTARTRSGRVVGGAPSPGPSRVVVLLAAAALVALVAVLLLGPGRDGGPPEGAESAAAASMRDSATLRDGSAPVPGRAAETSTVRPYLGRGAARDAVLRTGGQVAATAGEARAAAVGPLSGEASEGAPASLVASRSGKRFHAPSCRFASEISAANRVSFADAAEARSKGYEPCKVCLGGR